MADKIPLANMSARMKTALREDIRLHILPRLPARSIRQLSAVADLCVT
jgi:hypothetical protein